MILEAAPQSEAEPCLEMKSLMVSQRLTTMCCGKAVGPGSADTLARTERRRREQHDVGADALVEQFQARCAQNCSRFALNADEGVRAPSSSQTSLTDLGYCLLLREHSPEKIRFQHI